MCSDLARKTLIFVHMFRCGGNTLNRIMDWEYNPNQVFSLHGRYSRWAYHQLSRVPSATLSRMKVVRGHMPFGAHRLLSQEFTYITLLRDPVRRILSEYFAGKFRISHQYHRRIKHLSASEFAVSMANNNAQTKMIAGLSNSYDFLQDECTSEVLEVAKDNLQKYFSLVGITERFDETLALAKCLFGWTVPYYAVFNTKKGSEIVADEELARVAELNRFDIELYEYAVNMFEAALSEHAGEIAALRSVRLTRGPRLIYYRAASKALKVFGLAASTARSLAVH
jgi:hypothetical protein